MKNDYLTVRATLKQLITNGKLAANKKLPTEAQLIKKFGVSRYAIRKALEKLEDEKLIYRIQGSGMFVQDWNKKWIYNSNSKTIGLICTHIADYIFPKIISHIDSIIAPLGYSLLVTNTHNNPQKERARLINMLDSQVAGLIVEPSESARPNPNLDLYRIIKHNKIPILFLNACYPGLDFPVIQNTDEESEKELTKYLLDLGHQKILGIFQVDDLQGVHRMQGFIKAYQEQNIDISYSNIIMYSSHDHFETISHKIDVYLNNSQKPTAIVCYHDQLAIRIVAKLKKSNYQVPEDISVTGFDDYDTAHYFTPSLTTMTYETHQIGKEAGQGIIALIKGENFNSITHHPTMKIRNSTAAPK
ncbi:GntR family transcriptional regulator [Bombilactobacillus bombi]|uniref:GntR family transcriptional regulator n=1 Tax=Bombilactobacillus bombi TaxID=1303590 RepID=UPI0015E59DEF|nr:GntR family transcriptional regulator [Bombilactobacillus bombi]MBA1433960.1 GntR family transcriptional regulator [Bombilactobacillus bombi]